MNNCNNCEADTTNLKFCSRSCSTSYNNMHHPKRRLTNKCKECKLVLVKSSRKFCRECLKVKKKKLAFCRTHKVKKKIMSGDRLRCPKCASGAVSKTRRGNKARLVKMFGGKCQVCSYNRSMGALHFHHVIPASKSFSISSGGETRLFSKTVEESKKCILVCSNCHCEIHEGIRNITNLMPGPKTSLSAIA